MLDNMPTLTQLANGNYPILAFKIVNFFRLSVCGWIVLLFLPVMFIGLVPRGALSPDNPAIRS